MQLQMCMYLVFIGISIDFKMMLRGTEGVLDQKPPQNSGDCFDSGEFWGVSSK